MTHPHPGVAVALIGIIGFFLYGAAPLIGTRASTSRPKGDSSALPTGGKIAFQRNQNGRSQIYLMDASGTNQTNISNSNDTTEPTEPAWSPDGTKLVYASKPFFGSPPEIWVMNADGSEKTKLFTGVNQVSNPDWSPDGNKIAFDLAGQSRRIVVMNADGTNPIVLDPMPGNIFAPAWAPDSTKIAFNLDVQGQLEDDVWVMNADGTNARRIGGGSFPAWSPDGSHIAVNLLDSASPPLFDIAVMNADGSGQIRLTTDPAFDAWPAWSADGTKIIFQSNRAGNSEVFVMNSDGSNQVNLTNNPASDGRPKWQRIPQASAAVIQFSTSAYSVDEGASVATVLVTRTGDISSASASYATSDTAANNCNAVSGLASSRCDYLTTIGTLTFAGGESSKTISIPIVDDVYVEGTENFTITLSAPVGATLGSPATASVTINDNDAINGVNPIDTAGFFVRQHYNDFLNREPDTGGLNFWTNEINSCGSDAPCIEVKRINVSAAFFLSIEFQETGYLVYRIYKAGFGNLPGAPVPVRFNEFLRDTQQMGHGVQVGIGDWQAQLEANKRAFTLAYVQRADFQSAFPNTLTADQFVTQLDTNAGGVCSATEKSDLVAILGATPSDLSKRASVLRVLAEDSDLKSAEFNKAFVLMQYFGYMRRNPNDPPDAGFGGFNFWLNKLNSFNGNFVNAEMVKAFILSAEYRQRFGP